MKRNILAENMRRFGTKNLPEDELYENYNKNNNIAYLNRVMDAIASNGKYEYDEDALSSTLDNPTRAKLLSAVNALDVYNIDLYSLVGKYDEDIINTLEGIFKQVDDEFYSDLTAPAANAQSVSMSDDDILDIILTYTDDPDLAEKQLDVYRETGEFSNNEIEANVLRDPRWKLSEQVDGDANNNGYPDASENPSAASDIITHDNVSNYYNKPPEGYEFSAKPLTAPARNLLHSYWYNTASASEKEQEIKQDRADGVEWKYMQDNYKWLNTYRNRAITASYKLHRGRFLKKK
jgi:hypothetical protein